MNTSPATNPKDTNSDLATTRLGAALLTGFAREADPRGDRRLRRVYTQALGALAELHVERLRARLP